MEQNDDNLTARMETSRQASAYISWMSFLEFEQGRKINGSVSLPFWSSRHGEVIILRMSFNEMHHKRYFFKKQCIMGFFSLFPCVRGLMSLVFMCFYGFFSNTFHQYHVKILYTPPYHQNCTHISVVWHCVQKILSTCGNMHDYNQI